MNEVPNHHTDRVFDTAVGVIAPLLGVITSLQEQIEYALRITSLIIGIVVGLLAIYRSLKKPKP